MLNYMALQRRVRQLIGTTTTFVLVVARVGGSAPEPVAALCGPVFTR